MAAFLQLCKLKFYKETISSLLHFGSLYLHLTTLLIFGVDNRDTVSNFLHFALNVSVLVPHALQRIFLS